MRRVKLSWHVTFCIAEGWDFENRLPGANAEKEYNDEFNEKILGMSPAPNQS